MKEMFFKFLRYLSRFVEDSHTGSPSVKRYGLALAVTVLNFVMLVMGTVICIIVYKASPEYSIEMIRILSNSLEVISGLTLGAVTTGYLVDKAGTRKSVETKTDQELK